MRRRGHRPAPPWALIARMTKGASAAGRSPYRPPGQNRRPTGATRRRAGSGCAQALRPSADLLASVTTPAPVVQLAWSPRRRGPALGLTRIGIPDRDRQAGRGAAQRTTRRRTDRCRAAADHGGEALRHGATMPVLPVRWMWKSASSGHRPGGQCRLPLRGQARPSSARISRTASGPVAGQSDGVRAAGAIGVPGGRGHRVGGGHAQDRHGGYGGGGWETAQVSHLADGGGQASGHISELSIGQVWGPGRGQARTGGRPPASAGWSRRRRRTHELATKRVLIQPHPMARWSGRDASPAQPSRTSLDRERHRLPHGIPAGEPEVVCRVRRDPSPGSSSVPSVTAVTAPVKPGEADRRSVS